MHVHVMAWAWVCRRWCKKWSSLPRLPARWHDLARLSMCDFHSSGALTDHIRLTVCWVRFTHSALARAHTIGEAHSHDGPLHVLGPRGAANWQPIFHRERQRGHRAAAGGHAAKKRREGGRPGSPGVFGAAIGVHQLRSVAKGKQQRSDSPIPCCRLAGRRGRWRRPTPSTGRGMMPRTSRRWCGWWRRASTAARPVWRSSRWVEPPPALAASRLAALLADALIRLVRKPLPVATAVQEIQTSCCLLALLAGLAAARCTRGGQGGWARGRGGGCRPAGTGYGGRRALRATLQVRTALGGCHVPTPHCC